MNDWMPLFLYNGKNLHVEEGYLSNGQDNIPVVNDIPRFIPDASYAEGNFAKLRERHATLQLDSKNGTNDRLNTILERTKWPKDFFKDKLILECGCGAGPDTEILLSLGAKVMAVDLAGVDVAQQNIGKRNDCYFVQADITDLPLKYQSFDIVFCHRVIQHTPTPQNTLKHILQFVKSDGAVFVHSYARTLVQMLRWKYALRFITKRVNEEKLYRFISSYASYAFKFTNLLNRVPGGYLLDYFFIPFINKRQVDKFSSLSDEEVLEYSIHDTFDALSPKFDIPLSANTLNQIASEFLTQPYEIEQRRTVTILRSRFN
jgi:2-polyprenyl-3-methyl-5-hydroxy-6-metoxy-1,4-benzoquinol methylase